MLLTLCRALVGLPLLAPCVFGVDSRQAEIARLRREGLILPVTAATSRELAAELKDFSPCTRGRTVKVNKIGRADDLSLVVVRERPGRTIKCGHGTACYDPHLDLFFLDYDVLYAPFVSRNVGTQWVTRSNEDNRVRLYRQFVFLHELGHRTKHRAERNPSPERRLEMENEADDYALSCVVRAFDQSPDPLKVFSVPEPNSERRSRLRPPPASSSTDRAAVALGELAMEADIALVYGDQVSPYRANESYVSFVLRMQHLLQRIASSVKEPDVSVFVGIARENLSRVAETAKHLVAEIDPEKLGFKPASAAFDSKGFVVLSPALEAYRLTYKTIDEASKPGSPFEPSAQAFEPVCTDARRGSNSHDLERDRLLVMDQSVLWWRRGVGMFECRSGSWRLSEDWSHRGASAWSDVIGIQPYADKMLAVIGGKEAPDEVRYEIHGTAGLLAMKTRRQLRDELRAQVGASACELLQGPESIDRGTVTFRCLDRDTGYCRLDRESLDLKDCRLTDERSPLYQAVNQSGVFHLFALDGNAIVGVSSTFDPYERHINPYEIRASMVAESGGVRIASHRLIEDALPRDQDPLKWLTVIHPPLAICNAFGTSIGCWADRESAYQFSLRTGAMRVIFHPAAAVPLLGGKIAAIRTLNRWYLVSLE